MIQFKDGTFSADMPADKAFDQFKELFPTGEAKALHIGTRADLKRVREDADVQAQVNNLKDRLTALEDKEPLRSDVLHLPTSEDVLRFAPKESEHEI